MAVTPRTYQEVIISYDREFNQWHLYSDVPTLNRKWQERVSPESLTVEETGVISKIDGYLLDSSTVNIQKRRTMTEEQKLAAGERLRKARANQI